MGHDAAVQERMAPPELLARYDAIHLRPEELSVLCPSGFRRVVIADTPTAYVSLQAFIEGQKSFAHSHPDSEEWAVVLSGRGQAWFGDGPIPLAPGAIVGRTSVKPHAFAAGDAPLYLLSIQCPRPSEHATSWDQTEGTTAPVACKEAGRCRRCPRCGGHSAEATDGEFTCENCALLFG